MRIALLIANFLSGGAENVMVTLANGFSERGHEVDLLVGDDTGPLKGKVSEQVKIVHLSVGDIKGGFFKIRQYLKDQQPDILLSTKVHVNIVATLATKLSNAKTKVILREASTPSKDSKLASNSIKVRAITLISKFIYHLADGFISVSEGVKEDMSQFYKIRASKINTIYNPVISSDLKSKKYKAPDHPWFLSNERIIMAMGRVVPAKDFMTLIKAFKIVRTSVACKLMILGDKLTSNSNKDLFQEITSYMDAENIQDDIDFIGFKKNPLAFLKQAEVFVLSSIYEGLPGALIQALAIGCKIVSTDCPSGPEEILEKGKYGQLVPVKDPEKMAEAITQQLLSQEVIQDGYERVARFHVDRNMSKYLAYFEDKRDK